MDKASSGPRPQLLGYWYAPGPPALLTLPRPQRLVDDDWPAETRDAVIAYLRAGKRYETYDRSSWCRFGCGVSDRDMGKRELTDGAWVWPDGLVHYVEAHGVVLPDAFVAQAIHGGPVERRRGPDDVAPWRAWAAARGACLAIHPGWETMSEADERTIALQLTVTTGRVIQVLARRGDQLLVHEPGRLAIVGAAAGTVMASAADDDEAGLDALVASP